MSAIAKLSRANLAATALLSTAPAAAEETCTTVRHGQFFNAMQYCVSSVLAPQGENSYGPANLTGWQANSANAWCESVPGHGIGETITIWIKGAVAFRRLLVGNGYPKSSRTYRNNGRVKTLEITSDTGIKTLVNLADQGDLLPVALPKTAQHWIRLKIVAVYPGEQFDDTCLSFVTPDFEYEEELLLKGQGLLPKSVACLPCLIGGAPHGARARVRAVVEIIVAADRDLGFQ